MQPNGEDRTNPLRRKIDQCIRASGFDENFISACQFHLYKVLPQFEPLEITSKEEVINILMSNLFIDKMHIFPVKRFKSKVNELSDWPVKTLPPEIFVENKIPVETRKFVFYQCLRVGDFLDCRVTSSHPSSAEFQLRVIHKYGVTRILDDLNIIVTMRKADINELPQALKEFGICQLVRVVVTEKVKEDNETKVYVSVIQNNLDFISSKTELGAIPDALIPKYVFDPYPSGNLASYNDYLTSSRRFYDPVKLNGIYEGFGINPRGIYSYMPIDERLSSIDVDAMLKESKLKDVTKYIKIAVHDHEKGRFKSALLAINGAIKCHPKSNSKKDKVELSNLYYIKATIQKSENKPKMSLNACLDWLKGLNMDQTNNSVKIALSREMSRVAMKYYKKKVYKSAAKWASKALKMNEENTSANELMEYLKKKHSDAVADYDDELSLQDLVEKHNKIGSELKELMNV